MKNRSIFDLKSSQIIFKSLIRIIEEVLINGNTLYNLIQPEVPEILFHFTPHYK
jgi:hypothetical protein